MLIVNCGPDMKNKGSLGMLAKKVLLGSGCDNGGARFEVFSSVWHHDRFYRHIRYLEFPGHYTGA